MIGIEIFTYAEWIATINIFGSSTSPLKLRAEVVNNTNSHFTVRGVCISVKNNYLFWRTSTEILLSDANDVIPSGGKFTYSMDVRHFLNQYSPRKRFTVRIFGNHDFSESEELSINILNTVQQQYS